MESGLQPGDRGGFVAIRRRFASSRESVTWLTLCWIGGWLSHPAGGPENLVPLQREAGRDSLVIDHAFLDL